MNGSQSHLNLLYTATPLKCSRRGLREKCAIMDRVIYTQLSFKLIKIVKATSFPGPVLINVTRIFICTSAHFDISRL